MQVLNPASGYCEFGWCPATKAQPFQAFGPREQAHKSLEENLIFQHSRVAPPEDAPKARSGTSGTALR